MGWPRAAQESEKNRSSGAECCGAGEKRLKGVSKRQEDRTRKEGTLGVIRSLKRSVSSEFVPNLKHEGTVQMLKG